MRIMNKLFTKNRFNPNIECVFKHSIVCSALKRQFLSREILGEDHIPTGSHEENNALILTILMTILTILTIFLSILIILVTTQTFMVTILTLLVTLLTILVSILTILITILIIL